MDFPFVDGVSRSRARSSFCCSSARVEVDFLVIPTRLVVSGDHSEIALDGIGALSNPVRAR
ncbi:2-keto-4-pentenoate hydratase/2-oxohepta-3-ene-1,7-dioic acid hydratase in catechol pathway [Mycobacterium sp. URHB0021]